MREQADPKAAAQWFSDWPAEDGTVLFVLPQYKANKLHKSLLLVLRPEGLHHKWHATTPGKDLDRNDNRQHRQAQISTLIQTTALLSQNKQTTQQHWTQNLSTRADEFAHTQGQSSLTGHRSQHTLLPWVWPQAQVLARSYIRVSNLLLRVLQAI